MALGQQAQRSLYAMVGATSWMVGKVAEVPQRVATAWQERDRWLHRADETYRSFASQGQTIVGRADQEIRDRAGDARHAMQRIPGVTAAEGEVAGLMGEAADLPITDYDALTAAQIVQALPSLSQRELHMVEGYETRHRARSTILDRVEELRDQEPWSGYDEMTVDEILPRLRSLDPEGRVALAAYEKQHKQRRTIIDAAPAPS